MEKFKSGLKKAFDIHQTIGKLCTTFVISCFIFALIGLAFGLTKCAKSDEVKPTNHFLYEEVLLHNEYKIKVNSVATTDTEVIRNKKLEEETKNGHFFNIEIEISCLETTTKLHDLDCNDFKLKDHSGVIVPMSDIMGLVGWDAIDIHYDTDTMSSCSFTTMNCLKDYNFYGKKIQPGETFTFKLLFEMPIDIYVENELTVLEVDFYTGKSGNKLGVDIILLPNPF